MPIPKITPLQFAILTLLVDGQKPGRELRDTLAHVSLKQTRAAFYQLMSRLEDAQYVKGWYTTKVVSGQTLKERRYKISAKGIKAREKTIDFYLGKSLHAHFA